MRLRVTVYSGTACAFRGVYPVLRRDQTENHILGIPGRRTIAREFVGVAGVARTLLGCQVSKECDSIFYICFHHPCSVTSTHRSGTLLHINYTNHHIPYQSPSFVELRKSCDFVSRDIHQMTTPQRHMATSAFSLTARLHFCAFSSSHSFAG